MSSTRLPHLLNFVFMNSSHHERHLTPWIWWNQENVPTPLFGLDDDTCYDIIFGRNLLGPIRLMNKYGMCCTTFPYYDQLVVLYTWKFCYCDASMTSFTFVKPLTNPCISHKSRSWLVVSASKELVNGSLFFFHVSTQSVPLELPNKLMRVYFVPRVHLREYSYRYSGNLVTLWLLET